MFAGRAVAPPDVAELERVEALVRARYGIAPDDLVLVSEEPSRLPGHSGAVTTILFWTGRTERHRIRLFLPAARVAARDLPQSWLRAALRDDGEGDCC